LETPTLTVIIDRNLPVIDGRAKQIARAAAIIIGIISLLRYLVVF